jgi:SPP1 gp7 family putative phage head morphogenesis protein
VSRRKRRGIPLTRRRQIEARQRGGAVFYGKPLTVSAKAIERYRLSLDRAVNQMIAETEKRLGALYNDHAPHLLVAMDASASSQARVLMNAMAARFNAFFSKIAPDLAKRMADDVDRHSKTNLHGSLSEASGGLSLRTSVITGQIAEATKAAISANVALIKSIPQEYFTKIQGEVFRSIQAGSGTKDVFETVRQIGIVTKKRADLIARDQTSKATTAINAARMTALGIKKFEWLHSRGGREPRPLHINALNGHIFEIAKPPIIDERTGERGLPGVLINCGCRMVPVVEFGKVETDDGPEN